MRRGGNGECEGRFQIRLLEAGEHSAGISRLELRVEVSLVVDWIHESMEAFAGVHVRAVGGDHHLVFRQ